MKSMKAKKTSVPTRRRPHPVSLAHEIAAGAFPSLHLPHPLDLVFKDAVNQARASKGRHGHGRDFMQQTWLETTNAHGIAFLTGQAEKKLRESAHLDDYAARRSERLGALVYLAMAILKDDMDQPSAAG